MRLSHVANLLLLAFLCGTSFAAASTFSIGNNDFLLDGKPFQIMAGEMHPARIPHEYWADRLKMAHAMGLNTVSVYVFWNQLEPRPGQFDFSGNNNVAQFVRLAQQEGLWVILRPGPYVCAEWEFGGIPWWLLKDKDIKVRTSDPRYLVAAGEYLKALGAQLGPLQITHGGPIILAQVENEYGSFGSDHEYMSQIRDFERAAGFDVPFFTADGGGEMMAHGSLPDALPGLNGGSGVEIMKEIGVYRSHGPWLVPEVYPGWLDHWGEPHAHVGVRGLVRETEWKLTHDVSFCYYMIHGGTSFGFMNGANYSDHYQPQPTSYDYDAPIDEAGRPMAKYFYLREVFAKHVPPGQSIPAVPLPLATREIAPIELTEASGLFDNLPEPVNSAQPMTFEELDQGYGYVLYRCQIAGPANAILDIKDMRDFAVVCVGQKRVGTLDRRLHQESMPLQFTGRSATLDILVENCGRINYGREMVDGRKGIVGAVKFGGKVLANWQMFKFPFDSAPQGGFHQNATVSAPYFRQGAFDLDRAADTFLDFHAWGKGVAFVNGHNLGRYWNIGPQQTLYLPGVWLRQGHNQIVVFEGIKDNVSTVSGLEEPILNELNEP
jgi:beta-galactosidase